MEDIIPILIFVIIIFGSAIRKLIEYLANQAGTGDSQRSKDKYRASKDSIRSFLERIEEGAQAGSSGGGQQQARRKSRQRQIQQARQAQQRQESANSQRPPQAETSFSDFSQPEFEEQSYEEEVRKAEEAASRAKEEARKKAKLQKKRKRRKEKKAEQKQASRPPVGTVLERLRSARAGEQELKQAIVWYEVLNSPVALRKRPGHQPHVMERPQFGRPRKQEE